MAIYGKLCYFSVSRKGLFSFHKQADVNGTGKIQAAAAAVFLKRSGLKEPVLHKIWECCDRLGRGYLDKQVQYYNMYNFGLLSPPFVF